MPFSFILVPYSIIPILSVRNSNSTKTPSHKCPLHVHRLGPESPRVEFGLDREDYDSVAWDRTDEAEEESKQWLRNGATCHLLESIVSERLGRPAKRVPPLIAGGFNVICRMLFEDEHVPDDVVVRVPAPPVAQIHEEKTLGEVSAAEYLRLNTCLPIPRMWYHEQSGDTTPFGAFLIMDYFQSHQCMSTALKDPSQRPDDPHMLNPEVSMDTLVKCWRQLATYLLQISQQTFPRIGSLALGACGENSFSVSGRPITMNIHVQYDTACEHPVCNVSPTRQNVQHSKSTSIVFSDSVHPYLTRPHKSTDLRAHS